MSDLTLRLQDLGIGRLLGGVRDAVIVADSTTGRVLLWNQAATRIFGYSSSEALELHVEDLIPARLATEHGPRAGSYELLELPAVRKGGEEMTVEMSLSPIESLDGRFVLAIVRDATGRRRTHDRLIESERRFATVLSNARAYVYRCLNEPGWANEFASDYALELTGYPPEDLLVDGGVRLGDLIVEEDRQRVWDEVQAALERRERFEVRYAIRRKDGALRYVEDCGQGVYDERGEVVALEGILYDVTEAALAEERLEEAEERYRRLVERLPAIVYVQETNGRMSTVYDSPQIETMLGYPRDKYVEDPDYWAKILHPDDRERVLAGERSAIAAGEPLGQEYRVLASDGRIVWVRDEAVVVGGHDEERSYLQGFIFDITERKKAEEARHRIEASLAEAQRIAHLGSWEWNVKTGGEAFWSDEVFRIYGFEPGSFTPSLERLMEIVHPDDRARLREAIDGALYGGKPYDFEHRIVRPDGETRVVHRRAEVVFGDGGEPLRMVGTVQDVTELKQTERALEESEQRFRQLFEQSVDALFVHDESGRFVDCNSQACRLLGYSREELLGLGVSDIS